MEEGGGRVTGIGGSGVKCGGGTVDDHIWGCSVSRCRGGGGNILCYRGQMFGEGCMTRTHLLSIIKKCIVIFTRVTGVVLIGFVWLVLIIGFPLFRELQVVVGFEGYLRASNFHFKIEDNYDLFLCVERREK